jgi:catechol 2,3-dioxygenase-like lactoylglutathione lyase family enzyme
LTKVFSATIQVTDLEQATDFYCNLLGFKPRGGDHPPGVLLLQSDGIPLLLSQVDRPTSGQVEAAQAGADDSGTTGIVLAVETRSIRATMTYLKAKGVEFVHGEPCEFSGGLLADFRDPFGNVLRLVQPRRLKLLERPDPDQLPRLYLKDRDIAVLVDLFFYRVLDSQQVCRLRFAPDTPGALYGKQKRCQARLRQLWLHGYAFREEVPTRSGAGRLPLIYALDHQGARQVAGKLKMKLKEVVKRSNPQLLSASSTFLTHLMRTNDIRIAITLGAQRRGCDILEWLDDYDLHRDYDKVTLLTDPQDSGSKEQEVAIIPDGYFWLRADKKDFRHFVECDLRTLTGAYTEPGLRDWARRVRAVAKYYGSGKYHKRFRGGKSLRILTVTTSEARLATLKEIVEKVGGKYKQRFLFTTFGRLTPEAALTGEIWQVAGRDKPEPLIW